MKQHLFAAIMAAAGLAALTMPTLAADLYTEDSYYNGDTGSASPYDDPRYASIYGRTESDRLPRSDRSYSSSRSYRDNTYHDRENARCDRPDRTRYSTSTPRNYSRICLTKYQIRRKLKRQGWRHFELIRARPTVAVLKARQLGGDLYKIRVDRCSGDVLRARVIDSYRGDTYAYRRTRRYSTY